jgi:hypothetical protein
VNGKIIKKMEKEQWSYLMIVNIKEVLEMINLMEREYSSFGMVGFMKVNF